MFSAFFMPFIMYDFHQVEATPIQILFNFPHLGKNFLLYQVRTQSTTVFIKFICWLIIVHCSAMLTLFCDMNQKLTILKSLHTKNSYTA